MALDKQISAAADDPRAGMTFGELLQFAQAGLAEDVDPRTPVHAFVGWRTQVRRLSVAAGDHRPPRQPRPQRPSGARQ